MNIYIYYSIYIYILYSRLHFKKPFMHANLTHTKSQRRGEHKFQLCTTYTLCTKLHLKFIVFLIYICSNKSFKGNANIVHPMSLNIFIHISSGSCTNIKNNYVFPPSFPTSFSRLHFGERRKTKDDKRKRKTKKKTQQILISTKRCIKIIDLNII